MAMNHRGRDLGRELGKARCRPWDEQGSDEGTTSVDVGADPRCRRFNCSFIDAVKCRGRGRVEGNGNKIGVFEEGAHARAVPW